MSSVLVILEVASESGRLTNLFGYIDCSQLHKRDNSFVCLRRGGSEEIIPKQNILRVWKLEKKKLFLTQGEFND